MPYKIRSIQSGDSNDSLFGRISSPTLVSNGFEDISSDSNSSFDQTEFEEVYGGPGEWGCGRCGQEVHDSQEGVQCDGPCRSWVHTHCGNISPNSYRRMVEEEAEGGLSPWLCPDCSPSITSPPRTPLGTLSSGNSNGVRGQRGQERTPQEDRMLRKVSKRNHRGETPLHCSAIKGNVAMVRKLLRMGADPNTQDNAGWSPLHEACNRGNLSVAKLLLRHGAFVNQPGMARETPLHDASRNGHFQVVRLLLLSGADQHLVNNDGRTALSVASCPSNPCQNPELANVVKLLSGEIPLGETLGSTEGVAKGLFKASQDRILSLKIKTPQKPPSMSAEDAAGSNTASKEEDVYEFKTSKESTPSSSRASASPATALDASVGAGGEKRPKEEDAGADEEADGRQKKKRKEDTAPGVGRGRGIRGNSSEKTVGGKSVGRGRGSAAGSNNSDRKSPSGNSREAPSPAPSPGKSSKPPSAQGESDSDGEKKGEVGPKVPPLKIVLNSGTSNSREEDKKKNYIVNNGSEDGESSEKTEGAESSQGEGEKAGGRAERVTRSRGQQGAEEEDSQEAPVKEELRQGLDNEYHIKKRKLRGGTTEDPNNGSGSFVRQNGEPETDIEKHLNIRKQIEQRRKNLFPVQPKPPQGFKDYLMNKKTYHLEGNTGKDSRIQPIPKIAPPPSLEGALRDLFLTQENERYKLRMKHLVEKEKLVLAVEQEILRVHGRAARALANQSLPYSVCTILRDEEVYTPIDPNQEEKNRDIRSRYNGRLFLSWLQDVDDKWEKIKEQMVLRHHNEAESLNAVQKMDWEWKLSEINSGMKVKPATDDLHVPMVQVNEDFDQLVS